MVEGGVEGGRDETSGDDAAATRGDEGWRDAR